MKPIMDPRPTLPARARRRPEVLVCHDLGQPTDGRPAPDIDRLIAALDDYAGGAIMSVRGIEEQTYGQPDGVTHPVYLIVYDARMLRGSEANGIAYRAGYVSSITTAAEAAAR